MISSTISLHCYARRAFGHFGQDAYTMQNPYCAYTMARFDALGRLPNRHRAVSWCKPVAEMVLGHLRRIPYCTVPVRGCPRLHVGRLILVSAAPYILPPGCSA